MHLFDTTGSLGKESGLRRLYRICLVLALALGGIGGSGMVAGCSDDGPQGPKQVVIKLFGAMERNDKAAVANALDLVELLNTRDRDYALNLAEPRQLRTPTDVLNDLTGDGQTKIVWFSRQRVVGAEEIHGDTAYVEVTFRDTNSSDGKDYYGKFGLHRKIGGRWKIYSFRTPIEKADGTETIQ